MRLNKRSSRAGVSLSLLALSLVLLGGGLLLDAAHPVAAQDAATPRPLYALPESRDAVATSNTLAFNDLTRLLVAVNMLSDTISVVAPVSAELRAEIPVGDDPRSVAVTQDGTRALVANRNDATLSVVDLQLQETVQTIPLGGVWAYGVVVDDDNHAYVSLQGTNEVVIVDLLAGAVSTRITTPATPTALALWGDFLYVTHLWSGDISLIYLPQQRVVNTVSTGVYSGMSPSIDVDANRGLAYLPQTRSYADNPALTYDTTVFPVVNVMQLDGLALQPRARLTLDTAARPVNMPFAVQVDSFRRRVYVANAGSNDVSVIDLEDGFAVAAIDVGANPRGLLLNADNTRLFVHNSIDGTITIVDTANFDVIDDIPIDTQATVPVDVLIGAEWFHTGADDRLATDRWISCANCHLDGMTDGRVWVNFPDGARNTPALFNVNQTPPYNWSGTWDELADVELKIRDLQAGLGLIEAPTLNEPLGDPHSGLSLDLDALVMYMETLTAPSSPFTFEPALVERGEVVYEEQACGTCHTLPVGTNGQAYDVGTGGEFDTPTVNWLWLTAPYFHDGSAQTLQDVFTMPGAHQLQMTVPPEDIDALIAFLRTLPANESLTD